MCVITKAIKFVLLLQPANIKNCSHSGQTTLGCILTNLPSTQFNPAGLSIKYSKMKKNYKTIILKLPTSFCLLEVLTKSLL